MELADHVRPSVVQIETGSSWGSGVIYETSSGTAWILTNHHVIEGSSSVWVLVNDADRHRATIHGSDSVRDLAVLSINCSSCKAVALVDRRARGGESVFAMGYPVFDGGEASITRGIVSRVFFHSSQNAQMVQTDAPINPGNSGGPLFAMDGTVVGIVASKVEWTDDGRPVEGTGLAVASETVLAVLPSLRGGRTIYSPPPTATPTPPYFRSPGLGDLYEFGPRDGSITHREDGYIDDFQTNVWLSNFTASATFTNPYAQSVGDWDYGFLFRLSGSNTFHAVVVTSDSEWYHQLREGSSDETRTLDSGWLSELHTGAGESNRLLIVTAGSQGSLYVNDYLVATLDLSGGPTAGDVAAFAGYFQGHSRNGYSTHFSGFTVR